MRTVCGFLLLKEESEHLRHTGALRIRDRGTRLFHLQLPRSGFVTPFPCHGRWILMEACLPGGGGVDADGWRRTAGARTGRRDIP